MLYPSSYSPEEIVYPTSDGRPMGETDVHREQIVDLIQALEFHFRNQDNVYVSGNLLMFYEEGEPRKHRSPDVLVTLGIAGGQRKNYKLWQEGKAPDLIFEITSRSTKNEDLGEKKGLYCLLGVQEYVLFDPLGEYLQPTLRLYRKAGEDYLPVTGNPLQLETVGLTLEVVDGKLRLRDPQTGKLVPTAEEVRQRADVAEQEIARLREELARLRGEG